MKANTHPIYREVIFKDISSDYISLTRSTINLAKDVEMMKWENGKEYPVVKIDISSHSHPFFTGQDKIIDTAGRVEKFKKKYATTTAKK